MSISLDEITNKMLSPFAETLGINNFVSVKSKTEHGITVTVDEQYGSITVTGQNDGTGDFELELLNINENSEIAKSVEYKDLFFRLCPGPDGGSGANSYYGVIKRKDKDTGNYRTENIYDICVKQDFSWYYYSDLVCSFVIPSTFTESVNFYFYPQITFLEYANSRPVNNYPFIWDAINEKIDKAVFTITLTGSGTQADPYVVDKTPAEVDAAYTAGQVIQLCDTVQEGVIAPLLAYSDEYSYYAFQYYLDMGEGQNLHTYQIGLQKSNSTTTWNNIVYERYEVGVRIQFGLLPTASQSIAGKIYQYTGLNTPDYKNGYFYKCVSDGGDPATYSWQRIDVQPNIDVSGKANKVSGVPTNELAKLTNTGDLAASGILVDDVAKRILIHATRVTGDADIEFSLDGLTPEEIRGYFNREYIVDVELSDQLYHATFEEFDGEYYTVEFTSELENDGLCNLYCGSDIGADDDEHWEEAQWQDMHILITNFGSVVTKNVPSSGNASATEVVMGNDSRLSDARTPSAHNQAASTISAGTLAGRVQANATAAATLANAQVRDITISTTDLTAGTSALATGAVYIVYEA